MKKQTRVLWGVILAAVIVAGIVWTSRTEKQTNEVTIGAVLPLTGTSADAATHAKRGIELAVSHLNASREPSQPLLRVDYGDSKNMAKDGLAVFNKLAGLDRVRFFIATNSGVVVPLSEAVGGRNDVVLMITISSAPGVTSKGSNIFRLFVTAENEARTMTKFLVEKKKISRVAVFYINDDFGLGGMREFSKALPALGGQVVWAEPWEKGGTDFRDSLAKLPPDAEALYVIGYEAGLGLAVKQAREARFEGIICTTVGMSVPPWRAAAGEAAEGVYYTSTGFSLDSQEASTADFIKAYKAAHGVDANSFSAFAYDSMIALGAAIQITGGSDVPAVANSIRTAPPRQGALGTIQFDSEREADLPLRVWEFTNGKEQVAP